MELSDKLYNLYLKIIEKTENRGQIDSRFGCELKEGSDVYHISVISSVGSIDSGDVIHIIKFQDLESKISKDQYNTIVESVKERIKYFTKIEEERERKKQEIIVDRLLDKFKE